MRVVRIRSTLKGAAVLAVAGVVAATAAQAQAAESPTPSTTTTTVAPSPSTTTVTATPPTVTVTAPPVTQTVTGPTVTVTATPSTSSTASSSPTTTASAPAAARTVWVFGDSISNAGWISDPKLGWVSLVAQKAAAQGIVVKNFSDGGTPYHRVNPTGHPPVINTMIDRFASEGTVPDVVVIALGTNDVISHTLSVPAWYPSSLVSSMYAAIAVQQYLKSKGVKRIIWNTVYPWARHDQPAFNGASIPWYWLPELYQRTSYFNGWLYAMWGGDVVDTYMILTDWEHPEQGDARYFIDGFHPTIQGHARIAASFPMSALQP